MEVARAPWRGLHSPHSPREGESAGRARGRPQSSCPDPGPTVGAGDVGSPFQLAADARIMCTPAAVARALRSRSSLPSAEDATPLSSVPSSAQHGGMAASMASRPPPVIACRTRGSPPPIAQPRRAAQSRRRSTACGQAPRGPQESLRRPEASQAASLSCGGPARSSTPRPQRTHTLPPPGTEPER